MLDVAQGKSRARAWPRARGKPKTKAEKAAQEKFANAQLATKFMAPQILADFTQAVAGTPLLPRDLLVSQMYGRLAAFVLPGGRILWPMPARIDVSEALDAITQNNNFTLVRENDQWVGKPYGGDVPPGAWALIQDWIFTRDGAVSEIILDVSTFTDLQVICSALTCSTSTWRAIAFSYDGGLTWNTANIVFYLNATGTIAAQVAELAMHQTANAGARYCQAEIRGLSTPNTPKAWSAAAQTPSGIIGSLSTGTLGPITHVKIHPQAGGAATFNGGEIHVLAR